MYVPKHFAEETAAGLEVIRAHPFAVVVTADDAGSGTGAPFATHLPLIIDPDIDADANSLVLLGHIARANPHAKALSAGVMVRAIFSGPDGYISPNWYPSKHAGAEAVPTWNYIATHITGRIEPLPDIADKRRCVQLLSQVFEGDGPRAWKLDDEPEDYIRKMLGGIYAFRIKVDHIDVKAKLSQNRTAEDAAGAINGLQATERPGDFALAKAMSDRGIGE